MKSPVRVGFIGFGTVAEGAVSILTGQQALLRRRAGFPIEIVKIADRDFTRARSAAIPSDILTGDVMEVLTHPDIDLVVELIGGIEPARSYLLEAISHKKHVVTANKALLALHADDIFQAAADQRVSVGFEGSVGGGIPIIRTLQEGLSADKVTAIHGIVNGTCNYILSEMTRHGKPFSDVLKEAQDLGYAESNPTLDVGGMDSAHKLTLLARLAFETPIALKEISVQGIEHITQADIAFADAFGRKIKLLAIAKETDGFIEVRVHPTMIPKQSLLAGVEGVYNAICVTGKNTGDTIFYGKGAGAQPTGSAVVSDIIDIGRRIQTGADSQVTPFPLKPDAPSLPVKQMENVESLYYLRLMVEDKPGVLSRISGVLGGQGISISSMIQQGRKAEGHVPLVMMTHKAKERHIQEAIATIGQMPDVSEPVALIRVEED